MSKTVKTIAKLFAAFPGTVRADDYEASLAVYIENLGDLPERAVERAVKEFILTKDRLPRISEIRAEAGMWERHYARKEKADIKLVG